RAAVRGGTPCRAVAPVVLRWCGEVARGGRQYRDARRRLGGILRARDIARCIVGAGREADHHRIRRREAPRIRPCWIVPVHVDDDGVGEARAADGTAAATTTATATATTTSSATASGTNGHGRARLVACHAATPNLHREG